MDYTVRFKVEGHSLFPIDMLRYDGCYPVHEDEAHQIERSHDGSLDQERFRVELERRFRTKTEARDWHPTDQRWHSQGWNVVEINEKLWFPPVLRR